MKTLNAQSVAVVIGASGGIGAALTERLLAHTSVTRVWAACRQPECPVLEDLVRRFGDRIRPLMVDVTDASSIEATVAQIRAQTPAVHLLINAFGFLHDAEARIWPEKRIEEITPEGLLRNFQINAMAPALIARHTFALLNHRERAVFASLSARVGSISDNGLGGWYAYRSSKAAQNMLTRGFAVEGARRAKRLIYLALHPGTTDSGLSEPFQSGVPEGKLFSPDFAATKLLEQIDTASIEDSGQFFAWDGQSIPW
ncbi:MAG: SDR family NAD(P)-dependent oxidoreductase [Spiribacter sp.]|jgi:NAD(P)-dependent dehydrogenase (short-subunit alcohol dehydrogenase family)|nr:SDR family NAD(P)-dependent oxidoreductase [Spiribacter sp.]MDR9488938.1 SDR family NAD(P)-dependent oxidoreductase [Spiribacter sp.]